MTLELGQHGADVIRLNDARQVVEQHDAPIGLLYLPAGVLEGGAARGAGNIRPGGVDLVVQALEQQVNLQDELVLIIARVRDQALVAEAVAAPDVGHDAGIGHIVAHRRARPGLIEQEQPVLVVEFGLRRAEQAIDRIEIELARAAIGGGGQILRRVAHIFQNLLALTDGRVLRDDAEVAADDPKLGQVVVDELAEKGEAGEVGRLARRRGRGGLVWRRGAVLCRRSVLCRRGGLGRRCQRVQRPHRPGEQGEGQRIVLMVLGCEEPSEGSFKPLRGERFRVDNVNPAVMRHVDPPIVSGGRLAPIYILTTLDY